MTRTIAWVAACAAPLVACASLSADYAYSTKVILPDGTAVDCDVNESAAGPGPSSTGLTLTQERQAQVLATQRLRLLSGPYSGYPTPYTAPIVHCRPAT